MSRITDNLRFVFQPRRKPGLLFHTARSVLRHRLGGRPLRNIDVALDYSCNISCVHCSCSKLRRPTAPMLTMQEYGVLAEEMYRLGTIYVSFTGGEPMLPRADVEGVLGAFRTRSMLIGMQTNAMLLDDERAQQLRQAGVDVLQISVDGYDPEIHDKFRRSKGAHAKVFANIDLARKHGFRIILCTSVTSKSIHDRDIELLLEYAEREGMPCVVSVPCPSGNWRGEKEMLLDDKARLRLDELLARFPGFRRDFHSNYGQLGCSAGTEKLYITPTGEVIPCPFIHVSFGNVRDEPLGTIRDRMLAYERFTEYAPHCLAGEDEKFIDEVMTPTFNSTELPVQLEQHPILDRLLKEVPRVWRSTVLSN